MPRVCTVCTHADRAAIDQALVSGTPAPRLAALYRVSPDAVLRHAANHLPALLQQGQAVAEQTRAGALAEQQAGQHEAAARHALDVVAQLRAINNSTLHILREAREAKQHGIALQAIDRVQRQIELQAKLIGDLDDRPVVNVLISAEWLQVRAVLLAALAPYPEARHAVAAALRTVEAG
jgi:hypothetical protein